MKLITLSLSLCLLLTVQLSFAGDTTYRKKPVFMSFHAGYTLGRAGGSMPAMLADLNPQFGFRDAYQKTGSGFSLGVMLQKQFTELVYYKTGLSYVKKRVYPEENSYPLYQDSLNTGYLTIPFLFGIMQPLNKTPCRWC